MSDDITSEYMLKWRVLFECCEEAKKHKAIEFCYTDGMDYDAGIKPVWGVMGRIDIGTRWTTECRSRVEAKFCPFCAKPVPEIEPKPKDERPEKIQKITDGGYYCDTCGKRCNECVCAPCWQAWQPKQEPKVV